LLFLSFNAQINAILTNFYNSEIPGLKRLRSRDSRLTKTAGIPGLQCLAITPFELCPCSPQYAIKCSRFFTRESRYCYSAS